jgi:hypothetical protein
MAKTDTELGILSKLLKAARLEVEMRVHSLVNEDGEIEAREKPGTMACWHLRKLGAVAECPNVSDSENPSVLVRLEAAQE